MEVIIFIVLIMFSAFFSSAEVAFLTLRESQVRLMIRRREWNARLISQIKSEPQKFLIAVLIGNNIVNISIASLATVIGMEYFESFGAGIATGASTVIILLLGEIFPKSLAIVYKKQVAQWTAVPIFIFVTILGPVAHIFAMIEKWLRGKRGPKLSLVSEEEIRIMVELGLEHGEIDRQEREMIENVFNFDDTAVGSIMTPKKFIDALNGDVSVAQIAYYVSQSGYSRFPVYDGRIDNFVGYVHTNDVMRILNSDRREDELKNFVMPLTRIDESLDLQQVFRMMTKDRSHMYIVHKKGHPKTVVGLVTMEDIIEELVGDIEDEGDKKDSP